MKRLVLVLMACGGQMTVAALDGGTTGRGEGTGGGFGSEAGGSPLAGGLGVGGAGGGTAAPLGGSGGSDGGAHICDRLGASCVCPDGGTQCTSMVFSDPNFAWCIRGTCTKFCNGPSQAERDSRCPIGFRCVNYAFENEPPTWQCRQ